MGAATLSTVLQWTIALYRGSGRIGSTSERKLAHTSEEAAGDACFTLMTLDNHCELVNRGTAYVERALICALRKTSRSDLSQTKTNRIFDCGGPLSSFSLKIAMGHALGLYSEDVKHDLELLAKTRNDFAHRLHHMGLSDDVIDAFKCACDPELFVAPADADTTERFRHVCFALAGVLNVGRTSFSASRSGMRKPKGRCKSSDAKEPPAASIAPTETV